MEAAGGGEGSADGGVGVGEFGEAGLGGGAGVGVTAADYSPPMTSAGLRIVEKVK